MTCKRHKWRGPIMVKRIPAQGPNGAVNGKTRRLFTYYCEVCGAEKHTSTEGKYRPGHLTVR